MYMVLSSATMGLLWCSASRISGEILKYFEFGGGDAW